LHIAQVPPPPQAEGKNNLRSDKVLRSVDPAATFMGFSVSPLTMIWTSPLLTNLAWAYINTKTNRRITPEKARMEKKMMDKVAPVNIVEEV
jgi:hypothetical protein